MHLYWLFILLWDNVYVCVQVEFGPLKIRICVVLALKVLLSVSLI